MSELDKHFNYISNFICPGYELDIFMAFAIILTVLWIVFSCRLIGVLYTLLFSPFCLMMCLFISLFILAAYDAAYLQCFGSRYILGEGAHELHSELVTCHNEYCDFSKYELAAIDDKKWFQMSHYPVSKEAVSSFIKDRNYLSEYAHSKNASFKIIGVTNKNTDDYNYHVGPMERHYKAYFFIKTGDNQVWMVQGAWLGEVMSRRAKISSKPDVLIQGVNEEDGRRILSAQNSFEDVK